MTREIMDNITRLLSHSHLRMSVTIELDCSGSNKSDSGLRNYNEGIQGRINHLSHSAECDKNGNSLSNSCDKYRRVR